MCEFAITTLNLPFVNVTRDLLTSRHYIIEDIIHIHSFEWWRRPQDSNLQALSGQLLSRQLPHHPDRRHISVLGGITTLAVTGTSPPVRNVDRRPRIFNYINIQPPFGCPSMAFIICSAIFISFLYSSEVGSFALSICLSNIIETGTGSSLNIDLAVLA